MSNLSLENKIELLKIAASFEDRRGIKNLYADLIDIIKVNQKIGR